MTGSLGISKPDGLPLAESSKCSSGSDVIDLLWTPTRLPEFLCHAVCHQVRSATALENPLQTNTSPSSAKISRCWQRSTCSSGREIWIQELAQKDLRKQPTFDPQLGPGLAKRPVVTLAWNLRSKAKSMKSSRIQKLMSG